MELEVQLISLKKVWRSSYSLATQCEEAIGEVFAFDANVLEAQALADAMTSHEQLLRLTVKGLWEERPKRTVLAGYLPGTKQNPVCRLFLMSARPLAWNAFTKCVQSFPGYIESGQDFLVGTERCLLAWWEYPCTMVALWPSPETGIELKRGEGSPGESSAEYGWFYSDNKCYRIINRYFQMVE